MKKKLLYATGSLPIKELVMIGTNRIILDKGIAKENLEGGRILRLRTKEVWRGFARS